jgi:serine protease Do
MEDTLLIDATERFAKGEMSAEEKIYFEDLRKNNPELDQAVVEQLFFLNQLNSFSSTKNFKATLAEVENKLVSEKFLSRNTPQTESKLIQMWHRYKKDIAVAASIAGFVSICIASFVTKVASPDATNLQPLLEQIKTQAKKTQTIESKLNKLEAKPSINTRPSINASFRATGFMIDAANNYIVTNAHVIKAAPNRLIIENSKGIQYDAKAIFVNEEQDLAIIKIIDSTFKNLAPLPYVIRKNGAELGESIFMLGFPKEEIVYNEGYISAKNGYKMNTAFCQISTTANVGNSGSPVISKNGDLIGVISSRETDANAVVFAVKSVNIYSAVEVIKKDKDNEKIKIVSAPSLRGLDRVAQAKKMEAYVFMIKGNYF